MAVRARLQKIIVTLILGAVFLACTTLLITVPKEAVFTSVNDFLYQRKNIDLSEIGRSRYDLVIIDYSSYSSDGTDQGAWSSSEIAALKTTGESRFVLAYLSIGEAESFRSYWDDFWDTGSPDWVGREVPGRPGNYRVKYWYEGWWENILKEYLVNIVGRGYDGVYLDGIDAYIYWGNDAFENHENEELLQGEAADKMAGLVRKIAEYCRVTLGKDRFIICPHNGASLRRDASTSTGDHYVRAIDAVGTEDVFFVGNETIDNPYNPREEAISDLDFFLGQGKPVFVTEYLSRQSIDDIRRFYTEARNRGFIPFAADRDLGSLRINTGWEPD
jgi:cysteinyl-tRNA synthetase